MRRTPEDLIEDIRSYMAANYFNEPLTGILEEAANTIEILLHKKSEEDEDDIITNGGVIEDMLEELFERDEGLDFVAVAKGCVDGTMEIRISTDWWNAEYDPEKWGWRPEA